MLSIFQSTLPRGSDPNTSRQNPHDNHISIHAPSRERPKAHQLCCLPNIFQSTLPRGSDTSLHNVTLYAVISIHAPSRERQTYRTTLPATWIFQSTLPRGSDFYELWTLFENNDFNPRSLAGATSTASTNHCR